MKIEYDKFFIDTNILVYNSIETSTLFSDIEIIMNNFKNKKYLRFISNQIFNEYYSVLTNPKRIIEPFSVKNVIRNIKKYITFLNILPTPYNYSLILSELEKYNITGRNIFDFNIYITMKYNNIKNLITVNEKDFIIFKE